MRSEAVLFKQGSRYKKLKVHPQIAKKFTFASYYATHRLMKTSDRIAQLEKFYQEDPADPFNAYALALEYLKSHPSKARSLFETLLSEHSGYLPTYYHCAKFFQDHGDRAKTISVYEKGIALAEKTNDAKALRELRSAYDELKFE